MKKLFLFFSLLIISIISFGQDSTIYLKDNYFYTILDNGLDSTIHIKFHILNNLDSIKESDVFKNWEQILFSDSTKLDYIEKYKNLNHLDFFLMEKCETVSVVNHIKLKIISYLPLDDEQNVIYLEDNKIYFVLRYQYNERSKIILSKSLLVIKINDDMEFKEEHFLNVLD